MAAGLPVVVSDNIGCAEDLVRHGENGFVYPFGDAPALREALTAVLQPRVAERMGRASQERMADWGYREDVDGLKAALRFCTRLPLLPAAHDAGETHAAATL